MNIEQITVGPLAENCWLLSDPVSGTAVLVDPGEEADSIDEALKATGCTLQAIWLTHAHFDHVGAVAELSERYSVPVLLHPLDLPLYRNATISAAQWGIRVAQPPEPTKNLAEGDKLGLGGFTFTVWHLPGHAPGHVAFVGHGLCISGDVLFAGSIGRTDLPFCDVQAMKESLERLSQLSHETQVLPGHGPATTVGQELQTNPFMRGMANPVGARRLQ